MKIRDCGISIGNWDCNPKLFFVWVLFDDGSLWKSEMYDSVNEAYTIMCSKIDSSYGILRT